MLLAYFSLPFHQLLSKHVSSDHNASFHVTFSAMPTQLCQVAVFCSSIQFICIQRLQKFTTITIPHVHSNDIIKQNKHAKYMADTVLYM